MELKIKGHWSKCFCKLGRQGVWIHCSLFIFRCLNSTICCIRNLSYTYQTFPACWPVDHKSSSPWYYQSPSCIYNMASFARTCIPYRQPDSRDMGSTKHPSPPLCLHQSNWFQENQLYREMEKIMEMNNHVKKQKVRDITLNGQQHIAYVVICIFHPVSDSFFP